VPPALVNLQCSLALGDVDPRLGVQAADFPLPNLPRRVDARLGIQVTVLSLSDSLRRRDDALRDPAIESFGRYAMLFRDLAPRCAMLALPLRRIQTSLLLSAPP